MTAGRQLKFGLDLTFNGPMLFQLKATPDEYKAGLDRAIEKGWLMLNESGTFVKFTQADADLFA